MHLGCMTNGVASRAAAGGCACPSPRRPRWPAREPSRPCRFRRDVEDFLCARRFAQQCAAIFDGILLRRRGKLVDETFDHERVVRDANAAPEAGVEHRLLVTHEFDAHRRDVVEQLRRSIHAVEVDSVLESGREEAGEDRGTGEPVGPRNRLTICVYPGRNPVVVVGPIHVVPDVLLAVQITFTGPSTCLAMRTAWGTLSNSSRRPNPPPR